MKICLLAFFKKSTNYRFFKIFPNTWFPRIVHQALFTTQYIFTIKSVAVWHLLWDSSKAPPTQADHPLQTWPSSSIPTSGHRTTILLPVLSPLPPTSNLSSTLANSAFQTSLESFYFFTPPPKPLQPQLLWPLGLDSSKCPYTPSLICSSQCSHIVFEKKV